MSTSARKNDVVVEFTLSRDRKSALTVNEMRVPLFKQMKRGATGYGVVLDLGAAVPVQPGETRIVPGAFFDPEGARKAFPAGEHFTSFEIVGRVVRWTAEARATAAE